jgi:hypothetical protein
MPRPTVAELIPPELTPKGLITSPAARRAASEALAERGVILPVRANPHNPGSIIDASGEIVATVTGFVPGATDGIARILCALINICTVKEERS